MIRIETQGPAGPRFRKWYRRAVRQRNELLKYWKTCQSPVPATNVFSQANAQQIWNELKAIFLHEVFRYKCAYCEGKFGAGHPWHVEHYRPKSEVTEGRRKLDDHPGYFWLAYEWHNLLLSCGHCNTWEERTPKNDLRTDPSKSNEFRLKGTRVKEPGVRRKSWLKELQDEQPLLLNPYFDKPEDHLVFLPNGYIYGLSDRGRETVEVCNLNRIELVEARCDATVSVNDVLSKRLYCDLNCGNPVDRYFGEEKAYSAWLNYYVQVKIAWLAPKGSEIPQARRTAAVSRPSQPERMLGQAQAVHAILRNNHAGLTPEELKPYFGTDKSVRVDDLLKSLVDARMARKGVDGKYVTT